MRIVVIGGELLGAKLVTTLREQGHDAGPASPDTGVDTVTGAGLDDALSTAAVVIDVSDPPSFSDDAALDYFGASTRNLLAAEAAAGVRHHMLLSAAGLERLQRSEYFWAKNLQEELIENSVIPYSIVRATQFFEFWPSLADAATDGGTVWMPPVLFQPMAEDDVIQVVAGIAGGAPLNGTVEVAGPERFRMDEFIRTALAARGDPRAVITDPQARFFGIELGERTLLPRADAVLGETRFAGESSHVPFGENAYARRPG
jgi:uncharacterized protein YbjT (DUF2867 family)